MQFVMRKKPTKIKELQGTLEKSRIKTDEVVYSELQTLPAPPSDWPSEAQMIWNRLTKELKSVNLLFNTDLEALKVYAFACYRNNLAMQKINEHGDTILMTNQGGHSYEVVAPWFRIWKETSQVIDKYGAKFGFSPVDKTKIAIGGKEKDTDPFDEI